MKRFSILAVAALSVALAAIIGPAQASDAPKGAASLKGQFLVAAPSMRDPRFKESIIFIIDHDGAGAVGLIVNKTLGRGRLADMLKGLGIPSDNDAPAAERPIRLGLGGPVALSRGFFILHSGDWRDPSTMRVGDGIFLGRQVGLLRAMAEGGGPKQALLVVGYAGWSANQLESELARSDWLSAPADPTVIFGDEQDGKWAAALKGAGVKL